MHSARRISVSTQENEDFVHHDPVGDYIISLRKFYHNLVDYEKNLKEEPGPVPSMPEYPKNFPTPEFLHQRRSTDKQRFVYDEHLSKEIVDNLKIFAIKRILLQTGFDVDCLSNTDDLMVLLSNVTDTFLKNFMERMRFHKDSIIFKDNKDLYNPLETTLQEIGYNGVNGIATYYFEEYVGLSKALHNDCIEKLQCIDSKIKLKKFSEDEESSTSIADDEL